MRLRASLIMVFMVTSIARADWRADVDARIEKHRKGDFALRITGPDGAPLASTQVSIKQTRSHFGFGTCVATGIDTNDPDWQRYRTFIIEHFNILVCENAMKWYDIEKERGQRELAPADAIAKFARENDIPLRGHCIAWEKAKWTRPWQHDLPPDDLKKVVEQHIQTVAGRYKGKVFCWDVLNEILNGDFYTSRLGESYRAEFFKLVRKADPDALLFVNEYSILTIPDRVEQYVALVKRLQAQGAPIGGIGVQDHGVQRFYVPPPTTAPATAPAEPPRIPRRAGTGARPAPRRMGPEEIYQSLDRLAELNLPIHLTEVSSITSDPELRARTLEMFFRVAYSHPKVEALILWGFWSKQAFKGMDQALVDDNWNLTPAGKAVFNLTMNEWRTKLSAHTDAQGSLAFRGFYGRYEIAATDAGGNALRATVNLPPGQLPADEVRMTRGGGQ